MEDTDECLLSDGTVEKVIQVANVAAQFNYEEVLKEALFFLAILSTEVTDGQLAQYLLNKDIVFLFIKGLQMRSGVSAKLIDFILQALHRFFKYDVNYLQSQGVQTENSVIHFFEQQGGYQALNDLSSNIQSFELYS